MKDVLPLEYPLNGVVNPRVVIQPVDIVLFHLQSTQDSFSNGHAHDSTVENIRVHEWLRFAEFHRRAIDTRHDVHVVGDVKQTVGAHSGDGRLSPAFVAIGQRR